MGLLIFIGGWVFFCWNEADSVHERRALSECGTKLVAMPVRFFVSSLRHRLARATKGPFGACRWCSSSQIYVVSLQGCHPNRQYNGGLVHVMCPFASACSRLPVPCARNRLRGWLASPATGLLPGGLRRRRLSSPPTVLSCRCNHIHDICPSPPPSPQPFPSSPTPSSASTPPPLRSAASSRCTSGARR